jgi:hypothetical protein
VGFRPVPRPYVGRGFRKTNINIHTGDININRGDINVGGNRPGIDNPKANLYDRKENRDRNAERPGTSDRKRPDLARDRNNDVLTDRDGNVYRRDREGGWEQRQGGEWKKADNLDRERPSQGDRSGTDRYGSDRYAGDRSRPAQPGTSDRAPSAGGRDGYGSRGGYQGGSGSRAGSGSYPSQGAARPQLERDYRARQRGSARSYNYQGSRGGGARRGGGGRRR